MRRRQAAGAPCVDTAVKFICQILYQDGQTDDGFLDDKLQLPRGLRSQQRACARRRRGGGGGWVWRRLADA